MPTRKIFGLLALLVMLTLYCAGCVFVAVQYLPDSKLAELIFYPLAGIVWVFPAIRIVRWMQAPPDGT
ncbi:DUF2842 domain-containing protein [Sneathiella sp.]|jgi:hypothetical protein|uniref:DUF2842 domain-containing protein n=1 Tax=Sneathiella sp. TaxID=1964365 RepID=UPI002600B18F|nr:DUF2842 domain-containing protein [Sneathiella sp.]|tara:strand:+ start:1698 stop:1901 length:204 start_codon:yes stop_codon:yes gene_type:complete